MAANFASAFGADVVKMVRKGVDMHGVRAHAQLPFRIVLAGDPAAVSRLRAILLAGNEGERLADAARCVESYSALCAPTRELKAVLYIGAVDQIGEAGSLELRALRVPIFAIGIGAVAARAPDRPPTAGAVGNYGITELSEEALRVHVFPQLVRVAKGVEVALGRRLPVLRDLVATKLTQDAAKNAVKIAVASGLVDHVPILGIALGAIASAGDTVAITALQIALMMQIEATYGRDPDFKRLWELLPIIGGGLGWRTLARELSGFMPVAGVPIKGAIAYAGTIVVGEGITFLIAHGRPMSKEQASQLYARTKNDALQAGKNLLGRFRPKNS
ncbi:MAG: hypothetical protein HKL92_01225 [Candidatus Eremiobacteraeota bacterium]|nr:hypothetical protein [Candidatus Eremiobacteraeota bacterium]